MHSNLSPAAFLIEHQALFDSLPPGPVLDLACGHGRNALYLARKGIPVWCADRNPEALAAIAAIAEAERLPIVCWQLDLEQPDSAPLAGRQFAAIVVCHYLHRPLMPALQAALLPQGIIFYETFLSQQAQIGKPSNPDFLLKPGELKQHFASLQPLHYVEGEHQQPHRFSAQLIARNHAH
ncbi:class I SAM-dependent methyltransferase [Ferrimonas kyonanensis]|uniref:class I SAM-dependent methyltransferase n=1 Tax=Ferrimonas kyonanensis TaxID=364763 RepID=UPI000414A030|nr:methyltransferase domain-containing protein [Ferrimonas kyonanensis]